MLGKFWKTPWCMCSLCWAVVWPWQLDPTWYQRGVDSKWQGIPCSSRYKIYPRRKWDFLLTAFLLEPKPEEKVDSTSSLVQESSKSAIGIELIFSVNEWMRLSLCQALNTIFQINQFIASIALPNLRKFLMETDKVAATCTNIVYYVINPAMKGKSRCVGLKPLDLTLT